MSEEGKYQVSFKPDQIETRCKNDFNFLGAVCLPDVCTVSFPQLYMELFQLLLKALVAVRDFSQFAVGLPRGFAKTTFIKVLLIFIILFTKRKFILIVCASAELAEGIISDLSAILSSPNIIKVFGNWADHRDINRTDLKKFHFRGRNIIIRGIGSGTAVRGINLDNSRPDVMIMDDMQTQQEAESPVLSQKLQKWMVGTLMKAKSPSGCTFIYIGNMYRDIKLDGGHGKLFTCILRNLQHNPSWISFIVGGILADGTSLWEELQPIEQLLKELENDIMMGQAEVFFSEVLNDPSCGGGKWFDLSKMPGFDIEEDIDIKVGAFLMIDPSLGKKKSDAQVVNEVSVYDGIAVTEEVHIKQVSAPELVEWCLEYAVKKRIPLICAEAVAYQATLLQWFEKIAKDKGIEGIKFLPVTPRGRAKNSRILNWFKSVMENKHKIHPRCLAKILSQIQSFDPASNNNTDDILDTCAYEDDVVLNYPDEILLPHIISLEYGSEYGVVEDNGVF